MKRYCTATDDSNRGAVLDALEAVGFDKNNHVRNELAGLSFVIINMHYVSGKIGFTESVEFLTREGYELLEPSYIIAHAADLDGAKKPWMVAEKGFRVVTEEERRNEYPDCEVRWYSAIGKWKESSGGDCWNPEGGQKNCKAFAIPEGYTFPSKDITIKGKAYSEDTIHNALKAYVA